MGGDAPEGSIRSACVLFRRIRVGNEGGAQICLAGYRWRLCETYVFDSSSVSFTYEATELWGRPEVIDAWRGRSDILAKGESAIGAAWPTVQLAMHASATTKTLLRIICPPAAAISVSQPRSRYDSMQVVRHNQCDRH